MRYWLSIGDGKTYGPFDLGQIRQMQAEGRVPPTSQVCEEGSQSWFPAAQVLGTVTPPFGHPSAPMMPAGAGHFTPVSLVGPILVTLFCCLIGGIISIVYASNANTKAARGDLQGALHDAGRSKTWMWASLGAGILGGILYIWLSVNGGLRTR